MPRLRIAIVGMGLAGSYLAARLREEHEVAGFDKFREDGFDAVCAWGTSKHGIEPFAKRVGLNFDDYILHEGSEMMVRAGKETIRIGLKGLCTFDKLRFIKDMAKGIKVHYGCTIYDTRSLEERFDLIVDATGLHRCLLPRIERDYLIPCLQYKVRFKEPPMHDFYIRPYPGLTGYFWYFPLGDGYAHIGAGDLMRRYLRELRGFVKEHRGEIIRTNGRPIRITPPSMCQPFTKGRIVGVGESIGAVYPMLGEGIIPGLQCAELLYQHLDDLLGYRDAVLRSFKVYDSVFRLIRAKSLGNLASMMPHMLSTFLHMKSQEERYGMTIRLRDMLRVLKG